MSSGSAVGAAGRSNVARFFDGDASGEAAAAGGAFFLKDERERLVRRDARRRRKFLGRRLRDVLGRRRLGLHRGFRGAAAHSFWAAQRQKLL